MANNGFWDEIRKIPPVTRFLCGSSLVVSIPAMTQLLHPYYVIFMKDLVVKKFEVWRIWSSFFLGSTGINYVFEIVMLYRNANMLEEGAYSGRSADLAWQLILACGAIIGLNLPLKSMVHNRPLTLCLTYLGSALAPAGTQTSLFGLLTFPLAYLPYALIGMDFIMGGPSAAAQSVTGAIVGHLWWWLIFTGSTSNVNAVPAPAWARAPHWLRSMVGDNGPPRFGTNSGVHVVPPRQRDAQTNGRSTGYNWGAGQRLGSE
ncbi:DER1-domain-containing protein [Vararia minispora EC-137]|uniref:DER1-domain-containing protein n=1 Tax=Vararia minispora EC-137 TaxID=1314806 RepID=A0ACB8Q7S4_9AGAM|nr:DER1-domain-containing protein [Vararia minispora EC-137]